MLFHYGMEKRHRRTSTVRLLKSSRPKRLALFTGFDEYCKSRPLQWLSRIPPQTIQAERRITKPRAKPLGAPPMPNASATKTKEQKWEKRKRQRETSGRGETAGIRHPPACTGSPQPARLQAWLPPIVPDVTLYPRQDPDDRGRISSDTRPCKTPAPRASRGHAQFMEGELREAGEDGGGGTGSEPWKGPATRHAPRATTSPLPAHTSARAPLPRCD